MPYVPLSLPDHVPEPVRHLVADVVDSALRDIRFIMAIEPPPETGLKGFLQLSLAKLLLSAIDGAAQLLLPGKMGNGDRFKRFMSDNFPWERIDADHEAVCEFVWSSARCALIHRHGLHTPGDLRKFGRRFIISDRELTDLEMGKEPSPPFFQKDERRTVVWIEHLYWSLRRATVKALDTPAKAEAVAAYLRSGEWDRKANRTLPIP
jgi:hypothetical protein